ncbi:MAG: SAM-dependent methyltransferase [Acidobacteriia bacterium]|nr:SAM-dependent methyltransferase [Terriglobia bacterium]
MISRIKASRKGRDAAGKGCQVLIHPDETQDRLTSKLRIIQKRRGHRAAADDTLLAWAAARACPDAVRILDLGSGKGTVAMLLLQRLPRCRVIGLEALEVSHNLAVRNTLLNGLADRWEPRLGDLRDPSMLAGEPSFDLVTGAPPFMPVGSGVMPSDAQRAAGRFELRGGVREYAETAARHLALRGRVVLLVDGLRQSRARAEQALAAAGLFPHAIVAARPCPDRKPIYWILEASPEPGPTTEESLCMRPACGNRYSPEYQAIRREMDCVIERFPDSQPAGLP